MRWPGKDREARRFLVAAFARKQIVRWEMILGLAVPRPGGRGYVPPSARPAACEALGARAPPPVLVRALADQSEDLAKPRRVMGKSAQRGIGSRHRRVKTPQQPRRNRRDRIWPTRRPRRRDRKAQTAREINPRPRRIGEKLSPRAKPWAIRPRIVQQPLSLRLRAMITMSVRPCLAG